LSVSCEEGTWAAWLYDLLKPHVDELVVCNPRKNALLKYSNKSDRSDARKLADRLRLNDLKPVYHGETGMRILRELARSYLNLVKDQTRIMNRLKAMYGSGAISCGSGRLLCPPSRRVAGKNPGRPTYGVGGRVQITMDGHEAYLEAVEDAFGADIDYAMLQKTYGAPAENDTRFSPQLASAAI
jgi:transposase